MNNFKHLKKILYNQINLIDNSVSLFCENPQSDFTRHKKLDFKTTLKNVLLMEAGSLKDELLKINDFCEDTPTVSAFIQARDKIKVNAFSTLFHNFNSKTHKDKLFNGYRLIAIDGSELPIDNSIYDEDTTVLMHNKNPQSYSAFHLNASYDLLEHTYDDLIIQGEAKKDENDAFCQLVDRYKGHQAIFIADRGYESYNGFEHVVQSGNKYLVRVKDIHSKTSMAKSLGYFKDEEFDVDVFRMLTIKQTKTVKAYKDLYKFVPKTMRFDYMDKGNPFYEFNCRVVRFKIADDSYECIITNLDRDEFPIGTIKRLYHMRWSIETSFRQIKYALGLNALHSKKRKLIKQEIYARLTLYNLCERVVRKVKTPRNKRKYEYQANFTRIFHIIREYLRKKGGKNPPVENLIVKEILPIRPDRSNKRNKKQKSFIGFNYRFD